MTLPLISRGRRNETLTVNWLKYYLARRFWAHTTATRTITAHTMMMLLRKACDGAFASRHDEFGLRGDCLELDL